MQIDHIDRKILRLMQADPGISTADLAEQAGMTVAPCWRRLEKLKKAGVLLGKRVVVDRRALGYAVQVFLRINLDKTAPNAFDTFLAAARAVPEVETIQTLLGRVDIRMDEAGKPWVLEINANPCLTPDSGFVAAATASGRSYKQLIDLITSATARVI